MNNQDPGSPLYGDFPGYPDFFTGPSLLDDNFDCGFFLKPLPSPPEHSQYLMPEVQSIPSLPPIAPAAPLFKVIRKARPRKPKPSRVEEEGTYAMLDNTASTQA